LGIVRYSLECVEGEFSEVGRCNLAGISARGLLVAPQNSEFCLLHLDDDTARLVPYK
jgi:hypothetical protein